MRIALADDSALEREGYADYLEELGHTVIPYSSGTDLYVRLVADQPDLIVTDLQMPPDEFGGLWLLEQVRKTDRYLPIIVLSNRGSVPQVVRAMEIGGSPFTTWVEKSRAQSDLQVKVQEMVQVMRGHLNDVAVYAERLEPFCFWGSLTEPTRQCLANAEYLYHSNIQTKGFDFTGVFGQYTKAVELELNDKVTPVLRQIDAKVHPLYDTNRVPLRERYGAPTIWDIIQWLQMPVMPQWLRQVGLNCSSASLQSLTKGLNGVRVKRNERIHGALIDEQIVSLEMVRAVILGTTDTTPSVLAGICRFDQRGSTAK